MPTNPYFLSNLQQGATMERRMLEELIIECIKIHGMNTYVIPREAVSLDLVYGEDPLKRFSKNFGVEMYMNAPVSYGGAGNFFSKFGLEIRDDTTLVVTRRSYMSQVPSAYNRTNGGPREGDLIWIPLTNTLFEIKSVEEEKQFFTMGNKTPFYYELTCERYRYSNDRFATGIEALDDDVIENAYMLSLALTAAGGNGRYITSETVYMSNTKLSSAAIASANVKAVVVDHNFAASLINVAHTKGVFTVGTKLWGANSNASYVIASSDPMMDVREDNIIDNKRLENEANAIIDFTVSNPFGTP